ncbi:group II intron maturase-specific domain-containing protein [Mycobacterium servetii]|uniref:Group II intron maturase-specific domain-containing protein n=1 Tax=Mycobacterium servetii TaxID=3237418 RepID=A0ABV4C207_9MYCO
MAGLARSNYPGRPSPVVADEEPLVFSSVKVQQLQRALWAAAKQSSGRRFHALYDRIYRGDVLWEAWERVRKNKGVAGVDRITLAAVEDYGVDRMLRELRRDLRAGTYHPISPLLVNIFLHVLDTELSRRDVGELVRYADDGVVLCRSAAQAEHALAAVGEILASSGLRLHPEKTKVVDLREGREGLDFLGCHFRAGMSGRLWEQCRIVRYYLHRWPSQRAMTRLRAKVRDRTGRNRVGMDIGDVIADLNPILRGWGNYFRTGNAAKKFRQADWYVVHRLFNGHGLHRLRGTIRYPKAA